MSMLFQAVVTSIFFVKVHKYKKLINTHIATIILKFNYNIF